MKALFPALQRVQTEGSCLTFHLPAGLRAAAEPIEIGKYWCVSVSKPRKPRTTGWRSQNAHYFGHIQTLCEATGNEVADVNLYLKRRAVRRGYPLQRKPNGDIRLSLADGQPLPQSESEADTVEESYLIAEVHQLAAELDVQLVEYEDEI